MNSDTTRASICSWLKLLLVYILVILSLPVLVGCVLIVTLCRVTVGLFSRLLFRSKLSFLDGMQSVWATESVYTNNPQTNFIFHLICEGKSISVDELRLLVQNNVLNYCDPKTGKFPYKKLCQTWETFMGYRYWKSSSGFNLKQHVRLYDYVEPKLSLPSQCTLEDLTRVTGKLLATAYKKGTSPWELLLIPNYQSTADNDGTAPLQTVLCLRTHHSLADGHSSVGLIHRLFDALPPPALAKFSTMRLWERILRNVGIAVMLPYHLVKLGTDTGDEPNAWNPCRSRLKGEHFTFCSGQIPWESVQTIMRKYKVNSNAAIYSVTAGAAFRLMKEAGQAVPTGFTSCFVPFPLPNHPGGLVNHWSCTYFTIKPGTHSSAKLIHQVGKRIKRANVLDSLACIMNWMLGIVSLCPAWVWKKLVMVGCTACRLTFVFSNIPGPPRVLQNEGIRLVDIIPSLSHPEGPTAALAIMVSIAGKVRIVLNVDRGIFEGYRLPKDFAKHVDDEVTKFILNEDCTETQQNDVSQIV